MLMMIEVTGEYSQSNGARGSVARMGFVDVRERRNSVGASVRNLVSLMEKARVMDDRAENGKVPSLYESLPINLRAAVQKEQPTSTMPVAGVNRKVLCKRYYHPNTKTHNVVTIKLTPVSVSRVY